MARGRRRRVSRRRVVLGCAALVGCGAAPRRSGERAPVPEPTNAPPTASESNDPPKAEPMDTRKIPASGEAVPVIGLGTWQTFDVGPGDAEREPLRAVLRGLVDAGGRVVDSSPMYGRAEEVVGALAQELSAPLFLATKVWTRGRARGIAEMRRSMERLRTDRIDLMQVHNLLDVDTHLPVLLEHKAAGTFRYVGITHWSLDAFDDMERIVRGGRIDFIQLPYSVGVRDAEKRLLPAAADAGVAVLVMRPFEEGTLFERVAGRPLPGWAAEIDCASWAQVFLKWILAHPAVTCPIPATRSLDHLRDNVAAGHGRLPDEALRRRIVADLGF